MIDSSQPPRTSVIIVNYGTADLTAAAVDSVLQWHRGDPAVEVHVVDNASPGDDAAILARHHATREWGQQVVLHPESENHGFGRGNNVVLHQLAARDRPPEFVFLLNSDASLENDAIVILRDFLAGRPEAGIAGAGIAKPDGEHVTAAFRFPGLAAEFAQALSFGPVARLLASRLMPLPPDQPQSRVDWVAGAAVMMRMATLRDVDFFDPAFFLYYEEVDLMRSAARRGWQTWYVPSARVIHAEGASTGVKSGRIERRRRPAYWYHSWQYYHRKGSGRGAALLTAGAFLVGTAGNLALCALRGRTSSAPRYAFRDFLRFAVQPLIAGKKMSHD